MIFAKNFARNYEKKILGTSDAWSMSRSFQRTSYPPYHIEDCCILCTRLQWEWRAHKWPAGQAKPKYSTNR